MIRALWVAVLVALSAVLLTSVGAQADTWQSVKGYTEVRFSWDNMGLARQSARFTDVDARLDFTPTSPDQSSVDVRIRTASVQAATREFEDLLKRPEFFNAAANPYILFKSTRVEPTSQREGIVVGNLTLNGVTEEVALAVTWNFTGAHPLANVNPSYQGMWVSGFSAKATVQRSAFGLSRGMPLVSDEIEIGIESEFVRRGE